MSYVSQDSNKTHPKCISNSSKFPTVEYFMNGAIFILKYLVTTSQCDIFFCVYILFCKATNENLDSYFVS